MKSEIAENFIKQIEQQKPTSLPEVSIKQKQKTKNHTGNNQTALKLMKC